MMDANIRKKINHLAAYITDRSAIVAHINRDHGTRYTIKDIEAVIRPAFVKERAGEVWNEPLSVSPPLATTRIGPDPLAVACLSYGIKYGGVMAYDAKSCRIALERIA